MAVFDILRFPEEEPPERGLTPRPPPFEILAPAGPPSETPFEMLAPSGPPGLLSPPEIPAPAAPPREAPVPPSGTRVPPRAYVDRLFDLGRLWEEIYSMREQPGFIEAVRETERTRVPVEATLEVVAERERGAEYAVSDFLEIPRDVVERIMLSGGDPWRELLSPTLWDLERALVRLMPENIPGDLVFDVDEEGRFGLLYVEESPEI